MSNSSANSVDSAPVISAYQIPSCSSSTHTVRAADPERTTTSDGTTVSPNPTTPVPNTLRRPNRSASLPATGVNAAMSSAPAVTPNRTTTLFTLAVAVAYVIANTPHVLNAAPSAQRASSPATRPRR